MTNQAYSEAILTKKKTTTTITTTNQNSPPQIRLNDVCEKTRQTEIGRGRRERSGHFKTRESLLDDGQHLKETKMPISHLLSGAHEEATAVTMGYTLEEVVVEEGMVAEII